MALINCHECDRKISDQAKSCPGCGAPVRTQAPTPETDDPISIEGGKWTYAGLQFESREAALAFKTSRSKTAHSGSAEAWSFTKIASWSFGVFTFIWILSNCGGSTGSTSGDASKGISQISALTSCQMAMKQRSRDPERASIPYVDGRDLAGEYRFEWSGSTSLMRLRNGLGIEVGVSGTCSVSKATGQITSMTMDGQSMY